MDDSYLESARAKLAWAERLWKRMNRLNDEWADETRPKIEFRISNERDRAGRRWSVARLVNELPPPPRGDTFALLAGDFVHNTRTALDHLACACVRASGKEPTDHNAFPINERKPTDRWLENFKQKLARMDSTYVEGITKLQPYRDLSAPGSQHLLRLANLDNLDKHKLLLPVGATGGPDPGGLRAVTYGHRKGPPVILYNPGERLAPGVELSRYLLPPKPTGQAIHADVVVIIRLSVGAADVGLEDLASLRAYVVGIVESFGPSFDR